MTKLLKNIFKMNFTNAKTGSWAGVPMGQPLKYREASYTVAELEKRLTAEVNGFSCR
jgi:hypothetical protein